ncbi:MAG: hypothetical protein WA954_10265 [Parerythrobacter sp.]
MTRRTTTKNTAPISTHPAFPAVVALWFAALLGLGSLVIPVVVFEKAVAVTGLAAIGPFAPPLGTTSRLLIAGACTIIGAIAGIFLARRVAIAQEAAQLAALPDDVRESAREYGSGFGQRHDGAVATPRKPISARDELGADSFDDPTGLAREEDAAQQRPDDAPVPGFSDTGLGSTPGARRMPGRRRPLSVTDENERSEYLDRAPVPGIADIPAEGEAASAQTDTAEPAYRDVPEGPLDLGGLSIGQYDDEDYDSVDEDDDVPLDLDLSLAQLRNPGLAPEPADTGPVDIGPVEPVGASLNTDTLTSAAPPVPVAFAAPGSEAETESHNPFDTAPPPPTTLTPTPAPRAFDAPAEPDAQTTAETDTPADNPFQEPIAMTGSIPPANSPLANKAPAYNPLAGFAAEQPSQRPFAEPASVDEPVAAPQFAQAPAQAPAPEPVQPQPPLEELGMVELVDRFARALKAHGRLPVAAPAALPESAPAQPDFSAPQPFVAAPAPPPAPAPAMASMVPPVPAPAPARPAALTPVAFDDPAQDADADEDDSSEDASGFSSLLGIRTRPTGGEGFVRVDEQEDTDGGDHPVVIFPGQEARAAKLASEVGKPDNFDPAAPLGRPFDSPNTALDNANPKAGAAEDPNDTERALRDALEKLQRMSGAA